MGRLVTVRSLLLVLCVLAPNGARAQATGAAPTVIPLSGQLVTAEGQPRTGAVLMVISLYEGETDPAPRWIEHQQVALDAAGRYEVWVGSTLAEGLPADLFSGATAVRWAGVAVDNEPEQPRMMLVGVPYASNATSADTLAGKPASDFVLTANLTEHVRAVLREDDRTGGNGPVTNAFAVNVLQKGDGVTAVDSTVTEVGGNVGIGIAVPTQRLDVRNAGNLFAAFESANNNTSATVLVTSRNSAGATVQGSFGTDNGGSFRIKAITNHPMLFYTNNTESLRISSAGNVGIGTTAPAAKLDVNGNVNVAGTLSGPTTQALVSGLAALTARVARLESGEVAENDLVGTYNVYLLGVEMDPPEEVDPPETVATHNQMASYVISGTATLTGNPSRGTLDVTFDGIVVTEQAADQNWTHEEAEVSESGTGGFSWAYNDGFLTMTMDPGVEFDDFTLSVVPGGRTLVGALGGAPSNNQQLVVWVRQP